RLLGQRVYSHALAGDFGFPYLGLTVNPGSTFQATVGFDMQFGFGVSKTEGFYFDTSSNQELALTAGVTVPGLSATGHLGFLGASLADNPASPTALTAAFGVDVKDALGGNNRLTFSELTGGGPDLVPFVSVYGATPGSPVNVSLL